MTQPVLILENQNTDAGTSTFLLDVSYANSFCKKLNELNLPFLRPGDVISTSGQNKTGEQWEFLAERITVKNIKEIPAVLDSWFKLIPQTGL